MKRIEHIYPSWCVKNDGSQLFKDTVVKYLNDNYHNGNWYNGLNFGSYYGVDKNELSACCSNKNEYSKELTLDEFIKLRYRTKRNGLLRYPSLYFLI